MKKIYAAVAVVVCGLMVSSASGQASPERVDPSVAAPPTAAGAAGRPGGADQIGVAFSLGGSYTLPAELRNGRGDMAITRAAAEFSLAVPLSEKFALSAGVLNEFSWYQFSGGVGGDNTLEVATVRFSPGFRLALDDQWALLGAATFDASGEYDADVSDAMVYGGFFAARYKASDTRAYTFGVSVSTRIEEDLSIIPIFGVEEKLTDKLTFAVRGPGLRLSYAATEKLDVSLQASYESRDFRLKDDNAVPDAVFRDRRIVTGVQVQYTPAPYFIVRAEAGLVPWSEIRVDDEDGDRLSKATPDFTGYFGVSATLRF